MTHFTKQEELLLDAFIGYTRAMTAPGRCETRTTLKTAALRRSPVVPAVHGSTRRQLDFGCSADLQSVRDLFYDMRDLVHGRPIDMDSNNLQR